MNQLLVRIWFMVTMTLALSAVVVSLGWEVTSAASVGSRVVIILLMLAILGTYALLLYLTIKPSLKKLKSLPVAIWVTLIATGAIADGIGHFFRFVFSSDPTLPYGVIVATLLLMAGVAAYLLTLWVFWFVWRARGS